jgi:hypothetical protein
VAVAVVVVAAAVGRPHRVRVQARVRPQVGDLHHLGRRRRLGGLWLLLRCWWPLSSRRVNKSISKLLAYDLVMPVARIG